MEKRRNERGFISAIVVILLAILVLKYAFKIDVLELVSGPKFKSFVDSGYEFVLKVWNTYLKPITDVVLKFALIGWDWLVATSGKLFGTVKGPAQQMLQTVPNQ